jgi:hypothetical protein
VLAHLGRLHYQSRWDSLQLNLPVVLPFPKWQLIVAVLSGRLEHFLLNCSPEIQAIRELGIGKFSAEEKFEEANSSITKPD